MTSDPQSPELARRFAGTAFAPGAQVGEYTIVGPLGEGGMAEVYAAIHPIIHKRAAVKVIRPELCANPEAVERFIREARAANAIGHPNIVDVFAFGTLADGRPYFTMEKLEGETLAARIERGPIAFSHAAFVVGEIIDGLMAAHAAGVVHRDLKPENVFLVPEGGSRVRVKLLDFGIAKLVHAEVRATMPHSILGTPLYLSPEQARGGDIDHRADIYSLGCLCYELFLGELPFPSGGALEIVASHLTSAPPDPATLWPAIPKKLARLLRSMVAKDPAQRPTLSALRRTLSELRDSAIASHVPGSQDQGACVVRRSRPLMLASFLALVVAAGGVAFAMGWFPGLGDSDAIPVSEPDVASSKTPAVAPETAPAVAPETAPAVEPEKSAAMTPATSPAVEPEAAPVVAPETDEPEPSHHRGKHSRHRSHPRAPSAEPSAPTAAGDGTHPQPATNTGPPVEEPPVSAPATTEPSGPDPDPRDRTIDPFARDQTVDPF
ncbi:MAG TPA: protein kinase [Kofleriaceae bacterium]|nr:protein kinase [Kofleriaceae bacterium]